WDASAVWLSPDCHRSQYAFPVRVALEIALEDRHRAVTLATLGGSGAKVVDGLFEPMPSRGHRDPSASKTKPAEWQSEQLTRVSCKTRGEPALSTLQVYETGLTQASAKRESWTRCPQNQRKRHIDLVLRSIGGNDVGFKQIAAYMFLESAREI